ncbi:MAG: hypothetical protein ACOC2L_04840, partial [Candidatus Sumerlaeota bacterium]
RPDRSLLDHDREQPDRPIALVPGDELEGTRGVPPEDLQRLGGVEHLEAGVGKRAGPLLDVDRFEVHRRDCLDLSSPLNSWFESGTSPSPGSLVYKGETEFGFFTVRSLENQIGLREVPRFVPESEEDALVFEYPKVPPFPEEKAFKGPSNLHLTGDLRATLPDNLSADMRLVDRIEAFLPEGGPQGLGYIRGMKVVDPDDWFFQAHFKGDPVCPGSLGIETLLQVLKVAAVHHFTDTDLSEWSLAEEPPEPGIHFESPVVEKEHTWQYRGQVVPSNRAVTVEAVITGIDHENMVVIGDGLFLVDGLAIYAMQNFAVRLIRRQDI